MIAVIIGVGILIALIYLFALNRGVGVLVSCDSNEIIAIKAVPPPLMQMVQSKICEVNLNVQTMEGEVICNVREGVFETERAVIECPDIEDFKEQQVQIKANFYDTDGNLIGSDNKNLIVN